MPILIMGRVFYKELKEATHIWAFRQGRAIQIGKIIIIISFIVEKDFGISLRV